jgi:hypothetical protein
VPRGPQDVEPPAPAERVGERDAPHRHERLAALRERRPAAREAALGQLLELRRGLTREVDERGDEEPVRTGRVDPQVAERRRDAEVATGREGRVVPLVDGAHDGDAAQRSCRASVALAAVGLQSVVAFRARVIV